MRHCVCVICEIGLTPCRCRFAVAAAWKWQLPPMAACFLVAAGVVTCRPRMCSPWALLTPSSNYRDLLIAPTVGVPSRWPVATSIGVIFEC